MPDMKTIKVGDAVRISRGGWQTGFSIRKVDRLTKTQFIVGGQRFRRDSGRLVGGDSFLATSYARPATDEDRAALIESRKRNRVMTLIAETKWADLSTDQLQDIERILLGDTFEQE